MGLNFRRCDFDWNYSCIDLITTTHGATVLKPAHQLCAFLWLLVSTRYIITALQESWSSASIVLKSSFRIRLTEKLQLAKLLKLPYNFRSHQANKVFYTPIYKTNYRLAQVHVIPQNAYANSLVLRRYDIIRHTHTAVLSVMERTSIRNRGSVTRTEQCQVLLTPEHSKGTV